MLKLNFNFFCYYFYFYERLLMPFVFSYFPSFLPCFVFLCLCFIVFAPLCVSLLVRLPLDKVGERQ